MVSKKGLDYGSSGFQVPVIPRAPRSIRRKYPRRELVEDRRLCAIELLAAVAGKLLQESESSACSNAGEGKVQLGNHQDGFEKGNPKVDKAVKSERFDLGSCAESAFVPEISVQERNLLSNFEGLPQTENDPILEHTSALAKSSDLLKNVDCAIKLGTCEDKNEDENAASKVGGFICVGGMFNKNIENVTEMLSENDKNHKSDFSLASTSTVKDQMAECVHTDVLINSDSSVQLPFYRDPSPDTLLRKHWNNVRLGNRDNDEISFGCNKPSTMVRSFRPQSRIGYHKIKKVLASKYWKAASKLKDHDLFNTSERMKSFYRYRKNIYAREKCQRVPIKKRKLSDRGFAVAYNQESEKETTEDKSTSAVIFHRVSGASPPVKGHQKTKGPRVKFSIKSFRVPELYIEVLENETVGSLKRTVMEAVTAILGGGIRVGVVLKGKKVRDENRTLQQAGISQSSNLDTLGFTLEPSLTHVSQSMMPKKLSPLLPCDTDLQLPRSPTTTNFDSGISNTSDLPIISSPETPTDSFTDVSVPNSKALVPVPPMNAEALAIVPVNPKPKRTELSHRRTRRPFSVAEVEVLVEAVENLGTGRWRDVKMRAFEDVDHRTYVDLKDKWKTLVHTARISPQQRRGEPVPQDLLNRVLSAHEYWSQHQTKQHGKHLMEPVKVIDVLGGEIVGV